MSVCQYVSMSSLVFNFCLRLLGGPPRIHSPTPYTHPTPRKRSPRQQQTVPRERQGSEGEDSVKAARKATSKAKAPGSEDSVKAARKAARTASRQRGQRQGSEVSVPQRGMQRRRHQAARTTSRQRGQRQGSEDCVKAARAASRCEGSVKAARTASRQRGQRQGSEVSVRQRGMQRQRHQAASTASRQRGQRQGSEEGSEDSVKAARSGIAQLSQLSPPTILPTIRSSIPQNHPPHRRLRVPRQRQGSEEGSEDSVKAARAASRCEGSVKAARTASRQRGRQRGHRQGSDEACRMALVQSSN